MIMISLTVTMCALYALIVLLHERINIPCTYRKFYIYVHFIFTWNNN